MITGTWWGAHPRTLLILYTTTIRSVIEYGCHTFSAAARTHWKKIENIQNRCLRISLGCMNSTHIHSLEVMSGIPPLSIRFQELECRFLVKCLLLNHPVIKILDDLFDLKPGPKFLYSYRIVICMELQEPHERKYFNFDIRSICFIPQVDTSLVEEFKNVPKNHYALIASSFVNRKIEFFNPDEVFWTDGSLMNSEAGCGVYGQHSSFSFKLAKPCSVFTAEVQALLLACKLIQEQLRGRYVICSDSLSALKALHHIHMDFKSHPPFWKSKSSFVVCRHQATK